MDTQKLIEDQVKRKDKFTEITKPTLQRLTRANIIERLSILEKLFEEFKRDHENILKFGKPDIPYLVNNLGEKVMDLMNTAINELRQEPQLSFDLDPLNMTLGTTSKFSETEPMETNERTKENNNFNDRVHLSRKLEYKIQKLQFTIDSIAGELRSSQSWSKELVDIKNKLLFDQWNAISMLEEEFTIIFGTCVISTSEIYKKMNDTFARMVKKIEVSPSVIPANFQSRRGKLPDLKIPVFSGDFYVWLNFRDLYDTMIHNRDDIEPIEKMEYLKGLTDGEAKNLIKHYLLSADNYTAAYDALVNRYNNKRKLLTIYLENMSKPIGKVASAEAVKALYDGISEGMTSIKNMGIDNDSWGPIIVHLAILCLDNESRALFESKYCESNTDIPELADFLKFLESRYKTLEILDPMRATGNASKIKANQGYEKKSDNKAVKCLKCEEDHKLFLCPKFLALSVKSRYRFVKALSICVNCLYKHKDKCESKKTCKHCSKAHNSLLHFKKEETSGQNHQAIIASNTSCTKVATEEVMATAQLQVRDVNGQPVVIRVLIDTGAQSNFITEGLVQKLKLKRIPYATEITGIGKINAHKVKHAVEINLEPIFPSDCYEEIIALIMGRELTSNTPDHYISEQFQANWPTLQLADQTFRAPGDIDMILGIGFFTRIVLPEILQN